MAAGIDSGQSERQVVFVGQANAHHVQIFSGQQRQCIGVAGGDGVAVSDCGQPRRIAVGNRHHVHLAVLAPAVDVLDADAQADDANPQAAASAGGPDVRLLTCPASDLAPCPIQGVDRGAGRPNTGAVLSACRP